LFFVFVPPPPEELIQGQINRDLFVVTYFEPSQPAASKNVKMYRDPARGLSALPNAAPHFLSVAEFVARSFNPAYAHQMRPLQ
jgi:hypothetical protein